MGEFRSIEDLATQVGHFCWLEHRLFELTGAWASEPAPGVAGVNAYFHALSIGHGSLAVQWCSHLPVRAGIDPDSLVVPSPGSAETALASLADATDQVARLHGLVTVLLPRLLVTYDEDLAHASPVSETPIRSLLEVAAFRGRRALPLRPAGDDSAR